MTFNQIALLQSHLLHDAQGGVPEIASRLLQETLAPLLVAEGLAEGDTDEDALDRWSRLAWRVIHHFSRHPFTTQREIAEWLELAPASLVRLNRVLRRSDLAQELMVSRGAALKYWENTILPLLQTGVIEAARNGTARHPFRVGIYPGVSCMFYCTFCGRQPDARYGAGAVQPGNEVLESLFAGAPDDPYTFYISGGLEPLTNPGIGKMVVAGAERGFKLSMYTNGFMLTPQLLAKQPGLWQLDTLRISMYGATEQSATQVTCHPKAFHQVLQNATAFLAERNARNAPVKFGFNFVVLPGHVEDVLRLAEVIASINRSAGGRQVDFLTLREDYSVPPDRGLEPHERRQLSDVFDRLRHRASQPDLCDLRIDLGYALDPLSRGAVGTTLEMVPHQAMRPTGYPQVSVVVDLLGDVYLYREAGFLDRPGARRYAIGRLTRERGLEQVVADFLASQATIEPHAGDTGFFDIFDHVVTSLLNQADDDEAFGVPFDAGPIRGRQPADGPASAPVAHPTLAHPTLPAAAPAPADVSPIRVVHVA